MTDCYVCDAWVAPGLGKIAFTLDFCFSDTMVGRLAFLLTFRPTCKAGLGNQVGADICYVFSCHEEPTTMFDIPPGLYYDSRADSALASYGRLLVGVLPCPFIVLLCLYKRFRVQYMILAKKMLISPNGLPKALPGHFFPSLFCWSRMSLTAALAFRLPPNFGPRRTFSARGLGACTGFFLRCCLRLATSSIYCRRNSSASRLSASPSASSSFAAACVGTLYISTVTVLAIRRCRFYAVRHQSS